MQNYSEAGLIIIGDELLCGKRHDSHFDHVLETLAATGRNLAWTYMVGDDRQRLTRVLRQSMAEPLPVFCFGGIGATPDDVTRQCAAQAADQALIRHPQAVAEIEARFGEASYPNRILMAELPASSTIIPNPINRIPGFSVGHHHFFPGFPNMAWPMLDWVLGQYYSEAVTPLQELATGVFDVPETDLVNMLESLTRAYPGVKIFSLPSVTPRRYIELGVRGRQGVDEAFNALLDALTAAGIAYEPPQRG